MGSIGARTVLTDAFNGYFGDRQRISSVADRLNTLKDYNIINPNFGMSSEYRKNCALCSTAVALQLEGYNAEAMPRDKTWRGFNSVFEVDYSNPDNYVLSGSTYSHTGYPRVNKFGKFHYTTYENGKIVDHTVDNPTRAKRGAEATFKVLDEKIKTWGDGGHGAMSVSWAGRNSAHMVNVVNVKGQSMVYDGQ